MSLRLLNACQYRYGSTQLGGFVKVVFKGELCRLDPMILLHRRSVILEQGVWFSSLKHLIQSTIHSPALIQPSNS